MSAVSDRDASVEFSHHFGLIVHVIRRELDGPGQDEKQDQALCASWPIFAKLIVSKPDIPARKLAAWAGRRAAWRVRRSLDARRARRAKYLDALDVSGQLADQLADQLAAERALSRFRGDPECPAESQDRSDVESVIAQLPSDVQPAVRLVSYGRSHRDVARTLDVSRSALARLLERAATLIVQRDQLPDYEQRPDVDDDDFPSARIRPVQAADRPIPTSCEPNRARRALDYPIAFPGR